jgi:hypothetical protein
MSLLSICNHTPNNISPILKKYENSFLHFPACQLMAEPFRSSVQPWKIGVSVFLASPSELSADAKIGLQSSSGPAIWEAISMDTNCTSFGKDYFPQSDFRGAT